MVFCIVLGLGVDFAIHLDFRRRYLCVTSAERVGSLDAGQQATAELAPVVLRSALQLAAAFLVLRARQGGLPLAAIPLVLIVLNLVFSAGAYPLGKLSDSVSHTRLLVAGMVVLMVADALLALDNRGPVFWLGVGLWGLHMALTQGLLATMVANAAPPDLRGTAFGMFNLVCGVAMLLASGLAGWLWDRFGAPATFAAGMAFSAVALAGLARMHWQAPSAR